MTPAEAAELLTLAAAFDRRTVGRADATAWADALAGLEVHDCAEAIRLHFRQSTDYLMPAHVREIVREHKRARILAEQNRQVRAEIEAGRDADRGGFARWVEPILEKISKRGREAQIAERQARAVACGFCNAHEGFPCTVNGQTRDVAHPSRYDDASPVAAGVSRTPQPTQETA